MEDCIPAPNTIHPVTYTPLFRPYNYSVEKGKEAEWCSMSIHKLKTLYS